MRILYVCRSSMEATALARRLAHVNGQPGASLQQAAGDEWAIGPLDAVPTRRFDRVVVLPGVFVEWARDSEVRARALSDWYAESVLVRLGPGGLEIGR